MMKIAKMHGLGNSYIYVDLVSSSGPNLDWPMISRHISDKSVGIGSDGLILIMPSRSCDFRMRVFNADGSEARMCGNGIRCVGKYVYDHGLTTKREICIETLAGSRSLSLFGEDIITSVKVGMGKPVFHPEAVPFVADARASEGAPTRLTGEVAGFTVELTPLSMGNPHAVAFVDDVISYPVTQIGPALEKHLWFPDGVNVEFVEVLDQSNIRMRVWERGSGETMACGTGACAAAVVSHMVKGTDRTVNVHLHHGHLRIEWQEEQVYMTGPVVEVFSGTLSDEWFQSLAPS